MDVVRRSYKGITMARWSKHLTLSQRKVYNDYMRKYRITVALKEGKAPQPRKMAHWLLQLYKDFDMEYAVYFPQEWLSKKQVAELRKERARTFKFVRDCLPATYPTIRVRELTILYIQGKITKSYLLRIT